MMTFKFFNPFAIATAILLSVGTVYPVPTIAAPSISLPQVCQSGLEKTKITLSQAGISVTQTSISTIQGYQNAPQNAPLRMAFSVNKLPEGKDIYLQVAKHFNSCDKVGLITIGQAQTGNLISLGRINGTLQPFRCAQRTTPPLAWGEDICGL